MLPCPMYELDFDSIDLRERAPERPDLVDLKLLSAGKPCTGGVALPPSELRGKRPAPHGAEPAVEEAEGEWWTNALPFASASTLDVATPAERVDGGGPAVDVGLWPTT